MTEPIGIPEIKPVTTEASIPPKEESILIPEIKQSENQSQTPKTFKMPNINLKNNLILKIIMGIIIVLFILSLAIIIPGISIYSKANVLNTSINSLVLAGQGKDINQIKTELAKTKKSLADLESSYKLISWVKFIPFVGSYVSDGEHAIKAGGYGIEAGEIVISAIEPYADIIGFKNDTTEETAKDGSKTASERIDFVVKTIPELAGQTDLVATKVNLMKNELDNIDPNRYPVKFQGKEVQAKLKNGLDMFNEAALFVTQGKPLLEAAPYLLGIDGQRTYLVIFQNDKEIRPTGGFMTAYAIITVKNGKFDLVSSSDIYDLDAKYKPAIPAPEPIIKYLKGPYALTKNFLLRDMNWSPDFAESMKLFTTEAQKAGIKNIDGVIAVDTQTLVYILDAIGNVGVGGYGNFNTEINPTCNCPQVIYELESFASMEGPVVWSPTEPGKIIYAPPNYNVRKKIIGPLLNSILANAMGQPKDKLPGLFEAAFKSLTEKHVLFYLFDAKAQAGVESFNIAGRIKEYSGDYLEIDDANLGGRKSNLYVTQEVEQETNVSRDGSVEKTVTITYKNPQKQDGWLNSVLPNWTRVYVPKGSTLIAAEGFEEKAEPYEDLGKTVFAGFFQLRPEGVSKITLKYKLPFKFKKEYKMLIQKQPGTAKPFYTIKLGRKSEEFFLLTDKEIKFSL
jgi:hypothetical protein